MAALNDVKAIRGDGQIGVDSLPHRLGTDREARAASAILAVPQLIKSWLLFYRGHPLRVGMVIAVLAGQLAMVARLIKTPVGK